VKNGAEKLGRVLLGRTTRNVGLTAPGDQLRRETMASVSPPCLVLVGRVVDVRQVSGDDHRNCFRSYHLVMLVRISMPGPEARVCWLGGRRPGPIVIR
jgi:hypothetical protein